MDDNIVLVAAVGSLWGPGGERGVYKTTDGGATWKARAESRREHRRERSRDGGDRSPDAVRDDVSAPAFAVLHERRRARAAASTSRPTAATTGRSSRTDCRRSTSAASRSTRIARAPTSCMPKCRLKARRRRSRRWRGGGGAGAAAVARRRGGGGRGRAVAAAAVRRCGAVRGGGRGCGGRSAADVPRNSGRRRHLSIGRRRRDLAARRQQPRRPRDVLLAVARRSEQSGSRARRERAHVDVDRRRPVVRARSTSRCTTTSTPSGGIRTTRTTS